jgi:hypothetical protein
MSPVTLHCDHRDVERGGDLGHAQAAKVPQGHDLALTLVPLGQPVEGLVHRDQVHALLLDVVHDLIEWRAPPAATPTVGGPPPRMVDQDLPHGPRGRGIQIGSVRGLVEDRVAQKPDHGLVDHGRGRERVVVAFPAHQA